MPRQSRVLSANDHPDGRSQQDHLNRCRSHAPRLGGAMKRYFLGILRNVIGCIPRSHRVGNFWPALVGVGAAVFAGCMSIAPAQARDLYNKELFGHRVRIVEKDNIQRLMIDGKGVAAGKDVIEGVLVSIDRELTINGAGVLIGYQHTVATACDGSIFVVSLPKNRPFRLYGPNGDCSTITYEVEKNTIRFLRSKTYKPKAWTWTAERGFSAETDANLPNPFQDSDLWQDLSAGRVDHPLLLFSHPQMAELIKAWIGKEEDQVVYAAFGAGNVEHKGDLFVASSCARHLCGAEEIMFVFDTTTKGIFVSWKLDNKPLVVKPAAEQWSPLARAELDEWLKRWEEIATPASKEPAPVDTSADDLLNDLRNKRLVKPEDIFKHPGMFLPTETLLTGYRETVMSMVRGGQGTVEDKGNVIVGTSCLPDECKRQIVDVCTRPDQQEGLLCGEDARQSDCREASGERMAASSKS